MDEKMMCNNCDAPTEITNSIACVYDRLFNAVEYFKCELLDSIKIKYNPKYQCRCYGIDTDKY